MLPRIRHRLDGPPLALPPAFDGLAERWWRASPRSRSAAWLAGFALLGLAGISHAAASPHGPPTTVWIADHDLALGATLDTASLRRTSWPRDLVPDGALRDPIGHLVAPLPRGAVATDRHVGDGGVAAGLPTGTAAVALPLETLPDVAPGSRIDLVTADLDGRGVTLASDGWVLHSDGVAVWVAVDRASAVHVTGAALRGAIGVAVLPP